MALDRLTQITNSGISSNATITVTGVIAGVTTLGNTVVGGATTQLIVNGNTRITGILTIGTSSVTLDGTNNQVNVGSGVTIHHTNGVQVGSNTLHSSGLTINSLNASGIVTASGFVGNVTGNATGLSGTPNITVGTIGATSVNASGVVTATSFSGSGANLTGIAVTANVRTNSLVVSGVTTATGGIQVGDSFIKATSIGIGTTTTTGRNAGVGTATGTIIFNSTTNSLEIYNNGWFQLQVASFLIDALVVAGGGTGGGPGGIGGGGGSGGVLYAGNLPITLGSYPLTVGAGGISTPTGSGGAKNNGNPSNFGSYISDGGGAGGAYFSQPGNPGGSGGGSAIDLRGQPSATLSPAPSVGQATQTSQSPGNPYARMLGYGNRGGFSTGDLPANPGSIKVAGGGGAGGVGSNGSPTGAPGGPGLTFTIPGSPLTVGGGGGNAAFGTPGGTGGPGGGGNGQPATPAPSVNGTANTGGGGGGGGYVTDNAGSGGSGLVVLKVPVVLTTTFSPGLTVSTSTSQPGYNTYTVTAGTGTVTFS